jgi:hypothetical protein
MQRKAEEKLKTVVTMQMRVVRRELQTILGRECLSSLTQN